MSRQNLWAPWRISYVKSVADQPPQGDTSDNGCFMCHAAADNLTDDQLADHLVLLSDARGLLMMNRYPYTNGHLLAAPHDHLADLSDLTPDQQGGLMQLIDLGHRALQHAMNPQGMNVGLNLGRCAGAGLPGHLHFHIVPRWHGDVNFMDVVGQVRVIPQALEESYRLLRDAIAQIK
jgi:ATP adenylyltransferase